MKNLLKIAGLVLVLVVASLGAFAAQEHTSAETHESATAQTAEHGDAGEHGGEHAEKTYLGIPAWVLKAVNVIAFIGLLVFLMKNPIMNAFAERKAEIRRKLAEAEERRAKADNMAADIEARLGQIEKEVESILTRAREEGEKQKGEIVAAAERESEKILTAAKSQIDQRVKQARRELTEYAGVLATQKARALVESNLNDDDRQKIFEESVRSVKEVGS